MFHHTVAIKTSCLTTKLPYKLHVSPHSCHTNFMSHHIVAIQTSCLTTQLSYKLHVSPHSCHTNFMSRHTVTIQNITYFQWLSHSYFMSIMHTKILYPKLPNFKDLWTPKISGLTNTNFLCCSSHNRYAGITNSKAESRHAHAHAHEHKVLALNFISNRRVISILCTRGCVSPRYGGENINIYYTGSWTLLIYFDIICTVCFNWIKLSIHTSNKCAFDIYKYNLTSLLHASLLLMPSSVCFKSWCRAPWGWCEWCPKHVGTI